ncbi:MAG: hypothetical protein HY075_07885, partial [Deltaproteobacteria bacterium]|nr:hypothetical protein [Deltaproteobacteria bacterium]
MMGLAPFGKPSRFAGGGAYIEGLDPGKAFTGRGKRAWEASGRFRHYSNVAASVQAHFEDKLLALVRRLRKSFPDRANLIFTGGCALNCVANTRIWETGLFDSVYVPPFPGDESIAFGAAAGLLLGGPKTIWTPVGWGEQRGNFGPLSSTAAEAEVRRHFAGHEVSRPNELHADVAGLLMAGKTVG